MLNLFSQILDAVFPPYCVSCSQFGSWFCLTCCESMTLFLTNRELPPDSLLDANLSIGPYRDPRIRSLVTSLKFRSGTCVATSIRDVFRWWKDHRVHALPWGGMHDVVITWVPTDPRRAEMRGFDHAEIIAQAFQQELAPWMPLVRLLERSASRDPQSELPDDLRKANMHNIFQIIPGVQIPRCIILIDDVVTTGSTAESVARELKRRGVKTVFLCTLASGR